MLKRIGVVLALTITSLAAAPSASALTEVGNNCAANNSIAAPVTVFQLGEAAGNPLPLTFPAAGVVTRWRVNTIAAVGGMAEKLKVLRGTPDNSQVIGESAVESLTATQNIFETRISVQAGDRLGVYGSAGFFLCTGGGGDAIGAYAGDVPVGSNGGPATGPVAGRLAVSAFLEPDADGDQYGDETQDRCPQNPNVHDACPQPVPAITLDAFPIVLKRSVLVLVSASSQSPVQVFGQVGWFQRHRGGAPASKRSKPNDHPTGMTIGLTGGSQTVKPGEVARFNVKLPESVKRHLRQTSPQYSVKGAITARTTDLAGRVTDRIIAIRLPGQDRD
jgi:hypothetical protein